jgi:hypothetical protein
VKHVRPGFGDDVDSDPDKRTDGDALGENAEGVEKTSDAEKPVVVVISDEGQKESDAKDETKEVVEPSDDDRMLASSDDRRASLDQPSKTSSVSVDEEKRAAADDGFDLLALDSAFADLGALARAI